MDKRCPSEQEITSEMDVPDRAAFRQTEGGVQWIVDDQCWRVGSREVVGQDGHVACSMKLLA